MDKLKTTFKSLDLSLLNGPCGRFLHSWVRLYGGFWLFNLGFGSGLPGSYNPQEFIVPNTQGRHRPELETPLGWEYRLRLTRAAL